jgi:Lipocalin-like domain
MARFQLLLLFTLALTSNSFGQSKIKPVRPDKAGSPMDKLAGTWRLVEFANLDAATSTWIYPYGKNPKGYFTYTKTGIVNLNISSETPLKISEDSAKNYNIKLLNWVYNYSEGYFGTYSVDFNKSIVTHHVKGGSLPWYIDTDQQRPFILKGDTLVIGDSKTWKRVLVKED